MNNKIKPAVIGGVILGLLSAIPFLNLANYCCCLWAILGGVVASYFYIKSSPTPVSTGDGAVVGVLAGVIGAAIFIVVGIPLAILVGAAVMSLLAGYLESIGSAQRDMIRQMQAGQTLIGIIIRSLITAVLLIGFSTIGGLLGVAIFEKRKGNTVPPPAQGFDGTPGGGYAA